MRSSFLSIATLTAIVLGLAWAGAGGGTASAHVPHPGLNFWIAVDGVPDCDTRTADATCDLAPGTTFVIDAHLDPLPGDIQSYGGFDITMQYAGVTANHDASTEAWPDCAFPAASYDDTPNIIVFACAIGVEPAGPSSYSGPVGTISFVCGQSGSVSLLPGLNQTDLVEENIGVIHAEDRTTNETLTINCVEGGVTPIPTTPRPGGGATSVPPGTPLPPTEAAHATETAQAAATAAQKTPTTGGGDGDEDGGLDTWLIVVIIVAGVAGASAAGFVGWRYYQSRRGGGGT